MFGLKLLVTWLVSVKQVNYSCALRLQKWAHRYYSNSIKNSYHSRACDGPVQLLLLNVNGNKLYMVKVTSEEGFYIWAIHVCTGNLCWDPAVSSLVCPMQFPATNVIAAITEAGKTLRPQFTKAFKNMLKSTVLPSKILQYVLSRDGLLNQVQKHVSIYRNIVMLKTV